MGVEQDALGVAAEDQLADRRTTTQADDDQVGAVGLGDADEVLGGLEAIRALQRSGFQPRRSIELVLFTSEEPTRFGIGCIGSRTMNGCLTPAELQKLRDENDEGIDALRQAAGFTGKLGEVVLSAGYYDAFVELHIEQGPNLESMGLPIGVWKRPLVTFIAPKSLIGMNSATVPLPKV